ncbi:hypothetical protein SFRURICE_016905 [Spodoptera frugiperda]|nr:hypothetical protein SFRURICE_016905 [Spodoptera frugiperda]
MANFLSLPNFKRVHCSRDRLHLRFVSPTFHRELLRHRDYLQRVFTPQSQLKCQDSTIVVLRTIKGQ